MELSQDHLQWGDEVLVVLNLRILLSESKLFKLIMDIVNLGSSGNFWQKFGTWTINTITIRIKIVFHRTSHKFTYLPWNYKTFVIYRYYVIQDRKHFTHLSVDLLQIEPCWTMQNLNYRKQLIPRPSGLKVLLLSS